MEPADEGARGDELAPAPTSYAVPVAAVVVVVLAVAVVLLVVARPAAHRQRTVPPPQPTPTVQPTTSPGAPLGSLLTEAVASCVRTDHRSRVDVAMTLTNLTNYTLRVVSAAPLTSGFQVTAMHVGAPPCGAAQVHQPVRPGGDVVVGLRFLVGPSCPSDGVVAATLTIDAGGRAVHATTPTLASLPELGFAGCA